MPAGNKSYLRKLTLFIGRFIGRNLTLQLHRNSLLIHSLQEDSAVFYSLSGNKMAIQKCLYKVWIYLIIHIYIINLQLSYEDVNWSNVFSSGLIAFLWIGKIYWNIGE